MNNSIKERLDEEQGQIINSQEQYIMVAACPGSGKTYTITKRIEKELKELKDYQGIIACSFTNEAANELKKRIGKNNDIKNSFIGTFDSFVLKLIIKPFLNRYLRYSNEYEKHVEISLIKIPGNNKEVNRIIRNYDTNLDSQNEAIVLYNKWIDDIKRGIYEVSFPSYILAKNIIKFKLFNEFFADRYVTLYIDEAQDLNCFQYELLKEIKNNTNINIILVGDSHQSIYQFRGARPELFENVFDQGYYKYTIDVSVRCDASIMYYSNKIYDDETIKIFDKSNVYIINEIDKDFLNDLIGNVFILTESNKTAMYYYNILKEDFDIVYSKKLDIEDEYFNENRFIIEELIKYYLNYDNKVDKNKYPIDALYNAVLDIDLKAKKDVFKIKDRTLKEYLIDTLLYLKIDMQEELIDEIVTKLEEESFKYAYYYPSTNNKIMTIHSSKGLEADNVIIVLENEYGINDEYKNKLYVAMTRAKKNLYFLFADKFANKEYIENLIKY